MTRISPILFRLAALSALLCGLFFGAFAQGSQDSRPYAPIANPLPDTLDQLYRDSATIKIGRIRLNQAGYRPADDKYFYYVGSGTSSFSVVDANTGASVATGTLVSKNATVSGQIKIRASNNAQLVGGGDTRYTMESPAVSGALYEGKIDVSTPGQYRIRVGSETSGAFWIHENLYGWVRDAVIKFPGVNRCGNTESWFHKACHLKDATPGGWHDCGDHLKEGITQSYLHAMLALGSAALRDHDVDNYGRNHNNTVLTDGIPDVLYEAKHGSDYIIKAYDNAGGQVANMIISMGDGLDHEWWGQPEMQDLMPAARGGPPRAARVEPGANMLGPFAAGLALTAKNYAAFDAAYASKSIQVAKDIYAYAKETRRNITSDFYSGNARLEDKMAFGALGLLYATKEKKYLDDLCYDKTIYAGRSDEFPNFSFDGGWFSAQQHFSKGANTDWASHHMVVLWGFFRLILKDEQFCADVGITPSERLKLLGRTAGQILYNINQIAPNNIGNSSTTTIELPTDGSAWGSLEYGPAVRLVYEDIWKLMFVQMRWVYNRYQFGNIFDLFAYSDMAMWLDSTGIQLPGRPANINWKGREVRQLAIRQIDYMLGVNPWDFSMIYGIGHKNSNHPHHRAANPEGKNVPGTFYPYRPPVGALHGGDSPLEGGGIYEEHYDHFQVTETGIDASATMIIPIMGLALPDPITEPPDATVRTVYVGADMAIIEVRQTRFGMTTIRYAQDGSTSFTNVTGDSLGVFHRIVLTNLKSDTKYNFDALVTNVFGNERIINDRGELFTFTTLKTPPGPADISNVKVCRVTSDSADIFWFTPNGQYDSRVVYGTSKPPTTVHNGNIYGRPTQFHYVKIGGLKEKTTYYFYVESSGVRDDNGGQYYTFTTPVEHVEFDVRALLYKEGDGRQGIGLNIINQDSKSYDSLEFRLYFRAPDSITTPNGRLAFENHFMLRVDIGIQYGSDAYQGYHFKKDIDSLVQATRPIRLGDTYNPADSTWGWYIPVPMGSVVMQSGARFRVDLGTATRSWYPPYQDMMIDPPSKTFGANDWSFMPHSKAAGAPVDYQGMPLMTKDDTDNDYWNVPINQYITIYRKNEFVWGYSPSATEQQTKKTHYEMSSQITSPLYNPAEEYLFIEQVMPQITVNGWAKVTENGVINDIWVNGNRVRDVNSVARYDFATDRWNLAIPVPVKSGGNNIDITIFGGPENDCATCYGCAFSNHSFYLEFRGAEPYPSSMKLLACANQNVEVTPRDSARIDTTCFYVFVDDMNGNLNKESRDTVWVSIVNPVLGDSIVVPLVESGDSTGRFTSVSQIKIVSAPPSARGPNEISMDGGQVITVTYVDITDPDDISQISLASRAEFAVPNSAYFRDSLGVGSIDAVYIKYSKAFDATRDRLPDSLHLTIPGQAGVRVVKAPTDNIAAEAGDRSLIRFALNPAIENVTGFRANEQMTARSFLVYNGAVKEAVIPVQDKAGPALLHRALLSERGSGVAAAALDTIEVTLSEPMPGANIIGGTLVLRRAGSDGSGDAELTVASAIDSSLLTNSLTFLASAADGPVREGDSIYINPIGIAADRVGNKAHMQNRPVPVVLKTSTPRIVTASYRDVNADGIIDHVELNLSKALDLTGLRLWLSWGNSPYVQVDWARLSADADETVVRADIGGLLVDSVVTIGVMRAMATHNKFPGDTLRANVADKAAPVVKYALFSPGSSAETKDTLTVTFSEPLVAASARPFTFKHGESGELYSMVLQNENMSRTSATHTFIVSSIENGVSYPSNNDSLWINTGIVLYDTSANIQSNENNRRVKLSIKPAPISITVIPAPNPYRPAVQYSGDQPARIIVRPAAKVVTDLNVKGSIIIYDKLGSVVMTDTLKTPAAGSASTDLLYLWDGRNKKGRKVGTGAYLIAVSVEHVREAWEERTRPVTSRGMIYVIR